MKKRVTLISTALLIVMLLSVFSNFAFCVEAESTFEIRGDKYYLGLPLSKTPVVDDNTISANEYRFLSSLKSPIVRYDVFLDDADKADGRGKYNANYDKIADGNVYTDESLKRFSKEFDSYAAYDDQYIYIAFRDLGASGEDFYSYRSNYNIRFTLNIEDPTKHFVLTGKNVDEFKFASVDNSGYAGVELENGVDDIVVSSSFSKYAADGSFLKASNENNSIEEGAYELFYQAKISKDALLRYSNTYCETNYTEFPDAMYLNISAKHYTSDKESFGEDTNYEAMWFGGVRDSVDGEWVWTYNTLVFGTEGTDILLPDKYTPHHDVLRGQRVYSFENKTAAVKVDGNISDGEYTYTTEANGITQWFSGDGAYVKASSAEKSLESINDEKVRERTLAMLESLRYTFSFAEDGEYFYVAFVQSGGYAPDENGLGQWPCRMKTDIRIGFDPCDSSKYINVFYNNPNNTREDSSVTDDVTVSANFTSHPNKNNGVKADGIVGKIALKKFYTETMTTAKGSVNAGEQAVEGRGNNSQKAPSSSFVELSISKSALLELMKKNGYTEDTELSNILWFDLGATVYWVAQNAYGMTAGSAKYSSSVTFTGKALDRDTRESLKTVSVHMPDMIVFGEEKAIDGCNYGNNEDEKFLVSKSSCTESATYRTSCSHCRSAGIGIFDADKTDPHVYSYRVSNKKYLAEAADCENGTRYYYSCACGASAGDDPDETKRIFYSEGNSTGHNNISPSYSKDDTHHWHICTDCDKAVISKYEIGKTKHVYDKEVVSDEYLAKDGNCSVKTKYYKSCVCGASSKNASDESKRVTFDSGYKYGAHEYSNSYESDKTNHWRKCVRCGEVSYEDFHKYDDNGDADCNVCGAVREIATEPPVTTPPVTTEPPVTTPPVTTEPPVVTIHHVTTIPPDINTTTTDTVTDDSISFATDKDGTKHESSTGKNENVTSEKVSVNEKNKGCRQTATSTMVVFGTVFAFCSCLEEKKKR